MNYDFSNMLQKYAETAIAFGVNLQPNEYLVIACDINNAELARALTESAYKRGAKRVIVLWKDQSITKLNYTYATAESLSELFDWEVESKNFIADAKACYIAVSSADPDLLKDIDSQKISAVDRAVSPLYAKFYDNSSCNNFKWCVIAGASDAWAKKVFAEEIENSVFTLSQAKEKLWNLIFRANRIDSEDPIVEWQKHTDDLRTSSEKLNALKIKKLIYKNSLGTDFSVVLPENYVFLGGSELSKDDCLFTANMPTEEVFTTPHKYGANGKLVASLPLSLDGKIVKNFGFTFKDGKVVDYFAEEGKDSLKKLLETDDGAKYLGEVALVPFDSPINNTNTLFYSTLFDENARCHFALGFAYPQGVVGGEDMTDEQKEKVGINKSLTHVDFMVGTDDLSIKALTESGETVDIFVNGNFAI